MRLSVSKKSAAVLAGGVLVLATGGAALAYWTSNGSGTGTAATSAGESGTLVVTSNPVSGLAPGAGAKTISGLVRNGGSQTAYASSVSVSIASVSPAAAGLVCTPDDFTLVATPMPVGMDLVAGASAPFSGSSIAFSNRNANQDGCKGAVVNLAFVAS